MEIQTNLLQTTPTNVRRVPGQKYELSEHYNGQVTIKFYPESHRYQLFGRKDYLIGVTTATGMMDKSTPLVIWATRLTRDYLLTAIENEEEITPELVEYAAQLHEEKKDEAATKGKMVHEWAEKYIKGEEPEVPEDEQVRNGVLAFLKWVSEKDIKFIASEKRIFSKKHEYVGTMDCVFTMGIEGHRILHAGDYKTSSGIYLPMAFQVSGYQEADTEENGTEYGDKYLLRFAKEDKFDKKTGQQTQVAGEFEAKCFKASEHKGHFRGFLACLELKKQAKAWDKVHGYHAK